MALAGPVTIATARLLLRPFAAGDVEDSRAYRDDPEFARFLPWVPQPFTRRDAEEFVARNMAEPWDRSPTFAVVLGERVIGTVNLELEAAEGRAMLGYALARAHWGHGYAVEAARAALGWAFEAVPPMAKAWSSTDLRNQRSWRLMEKLGMRREAVLRLSRPPGGERHDEVYYGLLREEWEAGRRLERGPAADSHLRQPFDARVRWQTKC